MGWWTRTPSARLAPFVHSLWYYEGEHLLHTRERVMPVGFMQLLVNLDQDALRWWAGEDLQASKGIGGTSIGGLRTRAIGLDPRGQTRVVGVRFQPGGAAPMLGVPATELTDLQVGLVELWGAQGRVLRERLLEAGPPSAILACLESALVERLQDAEPDRCVIFAADALARGCSIAGLEGKIGMSARRFRDRFAAIIGSTPKQFARVERLQRALDVRSRGENWTEVAYACGYYDQAHLVREFRELAGMRPSQYRPRDDGSNHVPLEE